MLPVDEDRATRLFPGARQADADARRFRFARTVDDAAHDGERHRLDALVRLLPFGHLVADVGLNPFGEFLKRAARRAAASGTRRDARRKRPQAERLQQLAGRIYFLAPIAAGPRRQRHTNRVADPFIQQHAHRRGRPDQTFCAHAGLGQSKVQRLIGLPSERAIDGDQIARTRRLARDDDLILTKPGLDRQ